ncbi:helix-turn-helix transcriptional regulator [Actinopolymorpha sp. B17G11]|uniref:helix-turn-helix transcriptional regulator n=1 Tax=Actinopolymorpha sp. B17G11 TaxID=3160861 RepID=UPI0032E43D4C
MIDVRTQPIAPTSIRWLDRGDSIDTHRHSDHQVVYPASGVLTITTDRGSWIATPTSVIWVPSGVAHAHAAHGELELHLVGVPATTATTGLTEPVLRSVTPLLRELILECTRVAEADTPRRRRLVAVLVDQVRSAPPAHGHLPAPTSLLLRDVCGILARDPADSRTLAALGRDVGASERTLSRLFHAELGMTFPQWRTRLRLHHALELLAEGGSVTSVAHRCGWSSPSAFIDVFRRAFGTTPSGYRRPAARAALRT